MANITSTPQALSTADMNMDLIMSDVEIAIPTLAPKQHEPVMVKSSLSCNNNKRFEVVNLSGPINIILPIEQQETISKPSNNSIDSTSSTTMSVNKKEIPVTKKFDCNNPDDTLSP